MVLLCPDNNICSVVHIHVFVLEDTTFTRDSKKEDEFEEHILQQVQSMRSKDNVDVILSSSASVKTEENESVDESTIPKNVLGKNEVNSH